MKIFVTGGSGYIGSAVIEALHGAGHQSLALARSRQSAARLEALGSRPLIGDIRDPQAWIRQLGAIDGVIHLAATFDGDMATAERTLLDGLLDESALPPAVPKRRFIYTGGIWLYGPVGDRTAVEGADFAPPPAFSFMVDHRQRLFDTPHWAAAVVHPAIVWDESGGAISGFLEAAKSGRPPQITGNAQVRWPLVHRDDLAQLYVRALERGQPGADYHGVAESGVRVADIAGAIARRFDAPEPIVLPVEAVVAKKGAWAACEAWDQTMEARAPIDWAPRHAAILEALAEP